LYSKIELGYDRKNTEVSYISGTILHQNYVSIISIVTFSKSATHEKQKTNLVIVLFECYFIWPSKQLFKPQGKKRFLDISLWPTMFVLYGLERLRN